MLFDAFRRFLTIKYTKILPNKWIIWNITSSKLGLFFHFAYFT